MKQANQDCRRDEPAFTLVLAGLSAYAASNPQTVRTAVGDAGMSRGRSSFVDKITVHTLAATAPLTALIHCHQKGRSLNKPVAGQPLVENMITKMGLVDKTTKKLEKKMVESLGQLWTLYGDHKMTNSTVAFMHVASTLADPISCCTAYVAAGNGPLHAGALLLAYREYERMGKVENVPAILEDVKAKKKQLFGYGHRIYKTLDPRAKFIKDMVANLSAESKQ